MANHDTDPGHPGSKHQLNKYTKVPVEEESDSERKQKSAKLKGGLLISLSAAVLSIWLIWLTLQTGRLIKFGTKGKKFNAKFFYAW